MELTVEDVISLLTKAVANHAIVGKVADEPAPASCTRIQAPITKISLVLDYIREQVICGRKATLICNLE